MKRFWILRHGSVKVLDPSTWFILSSVEGLSTGFGFAIARTKNKRFFRLTLCAWLIALSLSAHAQQQSKPARIAYLSVGTASSQSSRVEALKSGLRAAGYTNGSDIFIEERYSDGKPEHAVTLVKELVRQELDVIVTGGPAATHAARQATATIPIVMAFDWDPVASGFITSLGRPGGNITGLFALTPEITGKQLEILKEVVPNLGRIAVLENSMEPGVEQMRKELEGAASALKVRLQKFEVRALEDLKIAFQTANKNRAEAVVAVTSFVLISQRTQIAELAQQNRLPAIYPWPEFVQAGGLMSYGANSEDLFRRAAIYVDKILKGGKPADLPVEQPTKFEFLVNLKAAKQINLTIPQKVLTRADRVIK